MRSGHQWRQNLHFLITAILALIAVPFLKHFNLPLRFALANLAFQYWVLLAERAIFGAVILCVIGLPAAVWKPSLQKICHEKTRLLLLALFSFVLGWLLGWAHGMVLTADIFAVLEVRERVKDRSVLAATDVLLPALYLFCGLLLVSAYNDIIVSSRFFAAADPTFNAMDQWLLGGLTVSRISHWGLHIFPLWWFHFLEFIYFGLFSQIGAALVLIACARGGKYAFQFVGAILTAYYLALVLFYIWPSQGPYYLCPSHFAEFPSVLKTYDAQKGSIAGALARWSHVPLDRMNFDYYIAFPCMHIVQPLLVIWFLRPWKRAVIFLVAYDVVLLIAIVFLEWHYLVDILVAPFVAALAILISNGGSSWLGSTGNRDPDLSENTAVLL